jgi:hypothetical protein
MTQIAHTNRYPEGLALLAVGLLALFVSSIPAVGEQSDSRKSVPGLGKKDAGVAIQSSLRQPRLLSPPDRASTSSG